MSTHQYVRKLYKYHAFNQYSLSALIRKEIWVAKPGSFNDPFDCNAAIYQAQTPTFQNVEQNRRGRRVMPQHVVVAGLVDEELSTEQKERLETMGVYCLADTPRSHLMWGHYADKFRGYCLAFGFNREQMEQTLEVKYKPSPPALGQISNLDVLARNAAGFKKGEWAYEHEYRIIYQRGNCYYERPAEIIALIFGPLIGEDERETLSKLLPDVNREFAQLNHRTLEIDIATVVS